MAAGHKVTTPADNSREPLVCNCRIRLAKRSTGEVLSVRSLAWDCPSCGRDKRKTLALMVATEKNPRLVTLTIAPLPYEGPQLRPPRHEDCDAARHVWVDKTSGRRTWHMIAGCAACCRERTRMWRAFVKRLRRRWPATSYLYAIEDHKSGAMHVHVALVGVPQNMTRRTRPGRLVKQAWHEVGGGFVDLGDRNQNGNGQWMGWYIGKYLAKRHDQKVAKGYRRWSRGYYFAPAVRMPRAEPSEDPDPLGVDVLGWEHPVTGQLSAVRTWLTVAAP